MINNKRIKNAMKIVIELTSTIIEGFYFDEKHKENVMFVCLKRYLNNSSTDKHC